MGTDECGIGHLSNGKTIFIPQSAPGDIVKVEIEEEKERYAKGRILEMVSASSVRVTPKCALYECCGGCSWQHLNYEEQCASKANAVASSLTHIAKLDENLLENILLPIVGSKSQFNYRNKLELSVVTNAEGKLDLAFSGLHGIGNTFPDTCALASKLLDGTPKALRGALRFLQGQGDLGLFRVGLRASERTRDVELALWTAPCAFPRAHAVKILTSALPNLTSIVRVIAQPGKARKIKQVEKLYGNGYWEENLCGARFCTSAPSFFQVNTQQAETLVNLAIEYLSEGAAEDAALENKNVANSATPTTNSQFKTKRALENKNVADLYCGGGTFSIPLARAGANVSAIEAASSSVKDLRRNARNNSVDLNIIGGDAAREIKKLPVPDYLVVDPPRAGLGGNVVSDIAALSPKKLVYVSCNHATLARDIARFVEFGYVPKKITPVDLFPQTYHVETVALLVR